ncbi:MAG: preprotein translocase subunit SecE [Planctomycetes bacterium]|nr:preprotein translocase subunit SecE [Planctomycetota bacterium]
MQMYKPGQGKYSRLGTLFAVVITVAIGCYRLYEMLNASDLNFLITALVPAAIFAVLSGLTLWLMNKPAVADFLIAAEGELKKVNWSSRKEVAVSTFVVIIVVLLMAVLLGTTDFVFQLVFQKLIG